MNCKLSTSPSFLRSAYFAGCLSCVFALFSGPTLSVKSVEEGSLYPPSTTSRRPAQKEAFIATIKLVRDPENSAAEPDTDLKKDSLAEINRVLRRMKQRSLVSLPDGYEQHSAGGEIHDGAPTPETDPDDSGESWTIIHSPACDIIFDS